MRFVLRLVISAVALWIATLVLSGITLDTPSIAKKIGTLIAVAAIFGVINAVLKPIVHMLGCGLYALTLGLISLVVNGLLFWLASWIASQIGLPFHLDNFWPTAILGALIVGVVSWLLGVIVPDPKKRS